MARGPLNFRQRDVTALVKAAENAGKKVRQIEVDKVGNIRLHVAVADSNTGSHAGKLSEWDKINEQELDQARIRQKLRG